MVVMLSKCPEILGREDEFLIVGLGFLETTPRGLLVLLFMSIYGIGSLCQNYSDLGLSTFMCKKALLKGSSQQHMLHKKQTENISINHLNNQTQNPPKKKNLNGALKWNLDKTEKTKKKNQKSTYQKQQTQNLTQENP